MAMNKEQLIEARARLFKFEGVTNVTELKASDRWKKTLTEKGGDERATMEAMMTAKESKDAVCFYIGHDEYVEWQDGDNGKRERVVSDEGHVVMLEDGTIKTFWKQTERLDVPPLTPLKVGPIQRTINFKKGTEGAWKAYDETTVATLPEDADVQITIPDLPLGTVFTDLKKTHKGYGTIFGITADWQVPTALLHILKTEKAVFHAEGDNNSSPRLNVLAIDSKAKEQLDEFPDLIDTDGWFDENVVRVDIDPQVAYDTFDLDETSEREEFFDSLAGERILVRGEASLMRRRTRAYYENAGKADDFDDFVTQAEEFLDEQKNGLRRLNLDKAQKQTGEDFSDGIDFLDDKVMDIREEKDGSFAIYISTSPSLQSYERHFEIKNGPNAGGTFVKNQGAFCVFVDYIGSEGAGMTDDDLDLLLADDPTTTVQA